jgi:hypothetical protein
MVCNDGCVRRCGESVFSTEVLAVGNAKTSVEKVEIGQYTVLSLII